ncbi:MAG: PEP-CTERM sorting domain-containing protein [Deltaproteobacteria bacterium]|nr:MAG: PEP-CTERM sorting domain-containing protein [Deltaproteobacteria bacterium]
MTTIARMALTSILGLWLGTPAYADIFSFSTGTPDGLLGALSQPTAPGTLETETADDFILSQATFISGAVIVGLIPPGTPLADISNVEVEVYHVFPTDSDVGRTSGPPTFPTAEVPARLNSPADVEIDDATRDGSDGTLNFSADLLSANFAVQNTVVTGIKRKPDQTTRGDGPATGEEVQISMVFTPPILLRADHYFFRPEVQVSGGELTRTWCRTGCGSVPTSSAARLRRPST